MIDFSDPLVEPQTDPEWSVNPVIMDTPPAVTAFDLEAVKKAVAPYHAQVDDMVKEAAALAVTDAATNEQATELGNRARTLKKKVEAIKKGPAYTEAYNFVAGVRSLITMFTDPLEAKVEKPLGRKIAAYLEQQRIAQERKEAAAREEARKRQAEIDAEQAAIKAEAERKAREAAEALKKETDEAARAILQKTLEEETAAAEAQAPIVVAPVIEAAPTVTRTSAGASFLKRPWTHEITDISLVPHKYLMEKPGAIKADIGAGIREIPGVRIFQKPQVNFKG